MNTRWFVAACLLVAARLPAQVDQERAAAWFREAQALCARDGGRLWGVSLCGPMVIADATTGTIATNRPPPAAPRPPALGFANAAMRWGEERWSTYMWAYIPADSQRRAALWMHELFHRVQPQLGLLNNDGQNDHLDTPDGRIWIQLEWRALARALADSGAGRQAALGDALAFRAARQARFPGAAANERPMEINEGLAEYTAVRTATSSPAEAVRAALVRLAEAPLAQTFVRSFPYATGAAYGLLLDAWSPGWHRTVKAGDDLPRLLATLSGVQPAPDAEAAAARYGAADLRVAEAERDRARQVRIAELRARFVEGAVLVLPASRNNSFTSSGITPIPGFGRVIPGFRGNAPWGRVEATAILMAADGSQLTLPAGSLAVQGDTVRGDGWTVVLSSGWVVRPGRRAGDYEVVAKAGSWELEGEVRSESQARTPERSSRRRAEMSWGLTLASARRLASSTRSIALPAALAAGPLAFSVDSRMRS
jgi:hypothetical protein